MGTTLLTGTAYAVSAGLILYADNAALFGEARLAVILAWALFGAGLALIGAVRSERREK